MDRNEKAQKRFLLMFETADPKEFERRKKRWLRSEALADIERGVNGETTEIVAQGTIGNVVEIVITDHTLRDSV